LGKMGGPPCGICFPAAVFRKTGGPPCGICFPVAVFRKTGGPPCVFDTRLGRHSAFTGPWSWGLFSLSVHSIPPVAHPSVLNSLGGPPIRPALPWWPTHPASGWVGFTCSMFRDSAHRLPTTLVPTHFQKNGWATVRHLLPRGHFRKTGGPPCGICFPAAISEKRVARRAAFASQWPFSEKRVGHRAAFASPRPFQKNGWAIIGALESRDSLLAAVTEPAVAKTMMPAMASKDARAGMRSKKTMKALLQYFTITCQLSSCFAGT